MSTHLDAERFRALTSPRSVALVGASDPASGSYGGRALKNLIVPDADRAIYPINRRLAGEELLDLRVYGSPTELPEAPDLSIVLTPAETVPDVLRDIAAAGGRCVVLPTAYRGSEPGGEQAFDVLIRSVAEEHDLSIIGPNCLGVISGNARLSASYASGAEFGFPGGGLAMATQSGAAMSLMMTHFAGRPVGFSHLISTGNEAVVDLPSVLRLIVEDEETTAIMLFVESVADGRGFREALLRAREIGKPVAALKVGQSMAGQRAAMSHTGRMTGDSAAYQALFEETGVYLTSSYAELFDFGLRMGLTGAASVETTSHRCIVVATSGGISGTAADQVSLNGFSLPLPSEATAARLSEALEGRHIGNPLDISAVARTPELLPAAVEILARSGEYDQMFLFSGAHRRNQERVATMIGELGPLPVPLSVGWVGLADAARDIYDGAGVVAFDEPLRAIRSASAAHSAALVEDEPAELLARLGRQQAPELPSAEASTATALELFPALAAAGVSCAAYAVVDPAAGSEALETAAESIGYPIVLKVDSRGLLHKSDQGGVVVSIADRMELLDAERSLQPLLEGLGTEARLVVQEMTKGIEVLVGARWDASFGHVLVVGMGGVLAEVVHDVRLALLPTTRRRLEGLLRSHEVLWALLNGYRGGRRGNTDALVELLDRLAAWLEQRGPEIQELDLNPVMVSEQAALVVDARAAVAEGAGRV